MGDITDENHSEDRTPPQRPRKIRDLFTDRIVGIVSGACIPVVLLLVPLANKYLDNSKEIQTLQLKENSVDIVETKRQLAALTGLIAASQVQIQTLTSKLSDCERGGLKPNKAP
jgi:hypothetical protein